jgi:hypothetical protein
MHGQMPFCVKPPFVRLMSLLHPPHRHELGHDWHQSLSISSGSSISMSSHFSHIPLRHQRTSRQCVLCQPSWYGGKPLHEAPVHIIQHKTLMKNRLSTAIPTQRPGTYGVGNSRQRLKYRASDTLS